MASGERSGTIFDGGTTLGLGPSELLGRFAASRDEAAFAALVAYHGPMVLATCRRILPRGLDADDAFQATFLVLARHASSIADPDRLAPWLHQVARRAALRAKTRADRRRRVEGDEPGEVVAPTPPRDDRAELRSVLDDELARLPAKYRAPLVLCYLEGLTHDQAAGQLRWPVGTVRSRLAGGRDRLRSRLARRGYAPADALVPVPLATVSPTLLRLAVRSASGVGVAPAHVLLLAQGVTLAMTLTSPKTLTIALLLSLTLGGAAVVAHQGQGEPDPPAAQVPPRVAADPPPVPPFPNPLTADYPLTVTGRATDSQGKPIAGARITLASSLVGNERRLAETRTDAAGEYRFEAVALPIVAEPNIPARGYFEVFGEAEGFGFAWRPSKKLALHVKLARPPAEVDPPDSFQPGELAVLDLTFPPPARLTGRAVDDQGRPLADAPVRVVRCDQPRPGQPDTPTEFSSFGEVVALRDRRTDAAGNFAIDGLAPDLWFFVLVSPQGFPQRRVIAATTLHPQPAHQGQDVLTGPLDLVFATPRELPFRVVVGDAGQPIPAVRFEAGRAGLGGGGGGALYDSATADAEGRGKIRLPPGEYQYVVYPEYRTPYLKTEGNLTVPADGPVPPVEATLRPACVLEVAVVDAATGAGIANVDLWEEITPAPGGLRRAVSYPSWEAATRFFHTDQPQADAAGKLRALVKPGPRRIGVGLEHCPPGWEAVEPDGQTIDGKPGETLHLTFPMLRP